MMSEPRRCPFCGARLEFHQEYGHQWIHPWNDCILEGFNFFADDENLRAWNRSWEPDDCDVVLEPKKIKVPIEIKVRKK